MMVRRSSLLEGKYFACLSIEYGWQFSQEKPAQFSNGNVIRVLKLTHFHVNLLNLIKRTIVLVQLRQRLKILINFFLRFWCWFFDISHFRWGYARCSRLKLCQMLIVQKVLLHPCNFSLSKCWEKTITQFNMEPRMEGTIEGDWT